MKSFFSSIALSILAASSAQAFNGWEAMKVLKIKGSANKFYKMKLAKDEKEQLVFVHGRQSKIELFSWEAKANKAEDNLAVNEFPLAPNIKKEEILLESIPVDISSYDQDQDAQQELLILAVNPLKLLIYKKNKKTWKESDSIEILEAKISRKLPMLIDKKQQKVYISCKEGIQIVDLLEKKARWMQPKEKNIPRKQWLLLDLDKDKDLDLVEYSNGIRWYEANGQSFLPPQQIDKKTYQRVNFLKTNQGADILALSTRDRNSLDRLNIEPSKESLFGQQKSLPINFANLSCFNSFQIGEKKGLAVINKGKPVMNSYFLTEDGWEIGQSFPVVRNVSNMVVLPNQPDTFLLYVKDAENLYSSHWDGKRFTFPKPYQAKGEKGKTKILQLGSTGKTIWWTQSRDKDLSLFIRRAKSDKTEHILYKGLSGKISKTQWLGGNKLLFKEKYASAAKVADLHESKTRVRELSHFKKSSFPSFRLYGKNEILAHLDHGILEWFDKDLQIVDQVSLPNGKLIRQFELTSSDKALALDSKGEHVYELAKDKSGIFRVEKSHKINHAQNMIIDPILGHLFLGSATISYASKGTQTELKLLDRIENSVGLPKGVREGYINDFQIIDIDNDQKPEIALFDYQRHQVTLLHEEDSQFKSLLSWQVFDSRTYPYGGRKKSFDPSPHSLISLDFDGDQKQDLAMLCHDRMLIYFAKETKND